VNSTGICEKMAGTISAPVDLTIFMKKEEELILSLIMEVKKLEKDFGRKS